ncbi:hypothetical protein OIDMADRAFT_102129 [Oidiodendron maius Zn]|uniref:Smr domain-containing protein n=1 Tax=Oidiodendron maius (strain Zn) TaxID=913774 RepID=A0A0C3HL04_OIDMZ|nr:hypothetical protein OIDMADRAFT_102129 [Oidiodendron maius Zn]
MAAVSYQMDHLGGKAFNHSQSSDAEAEYDRLRNLARQEAGKRSSCLDKAHQAYERGDGATAHHLSEEGKKHAAQMDAYNQQASDFIFRENNAPGRVDADTIDLHGQFVEEAERILEQRIKYAQQQGQRGLHVIVGKGNHSVNHVQKIKPRVEQVCQELGLQYATEENEGRMYVNLQGGPAVMPPSHSGQYGGQHGSHQQPHSAPQQGYQAPHQPQYQSGQQVQNNQQDEVTGLISMLLKCLCK